MLPFFIAQTLAFASDCNIDSINDYDVNYKVYVCDAELGENVKIAKDWWNSHGKSIEIVSYNYSCNRAPEHGEIFVEFNNEEVAKMETETTYALASTTRNHAIDSDTVVAARMFFSTTLKHMPDDLLTLTVHEMGHAIGYGHVPRHCDQHIMNPILKYMGESL